MITDVKTLEEFIRSGQLQQVAFAQAASQRMSRFEADDFVQETSVSMLKAVMRGQSIDNPPAFTSSVARNQSFRVRRRRERQRSNQSESFDRRRSDESSPVNQTIRNETISKVRKTVGELSSENQILALHIAERVPLRVTADRLKVAVTTVFDRRNKLKAYLADQFRRSDVSVNTFDDE